MDFLTGERLGRNSDRSWEVVSEHAAALLLVANPKEAASEGAERDEHDDDEAICTLTTPVLPNPSTEEAEVAMTRQTNYPNPKSQIFSSQLLYTRHQIDQTTSLQNVVPRWLQSLRFPQYKPVRPGTQRYICIRG